MEILVAEAYTIFIINISICFNKRFFCVSIPDKEANWELPTLTRCQNVFEATKSLCRRAWKNCLNLSKFVPCRIFKVGKMGNNATVNFAINMSYELGK